MKVEDIKVTEEELTLIKNAISNKQSVEFSCTNLTPSEKKRFLEILQIFLEECQQEHLYNCLSYCLLELLDNAGKANVKRLYFQEKNLDINNEEDYKQGMERFKEDISDNGTSFPDVTKDNILQVYLSLSADGLIRIKVSNNTKITKNEYDRILARIERTKKYNNIQDASDDIDFSEGSGLGIISIILLLKKLDPERSQLKFNFTDNLTETMIEIPLDTFEEL